MPPPRPRPARWDPLAAMTLGARPAATVQVKSPIVPTGGVLTVVALGFGPRVEVLLDLRTPLATFDLTDGAGHLRLPLPATVGTGRHLLTFASGPAAGGTGHTGDEDVQVDLLIDVTASSAAVTLDDQVVAPGGTVSFVARGFPPGETGHVKLDSEGAASPFPIGADGVGEGRFTVPAGTGPGAHHLRFLAPNPSTSTRVAIEVADAPVPDGTSTRPPRPAGRGR